MSNEENSSPEEPSIPEPENPGEPLDIGAPEPENPGEILEKALKPSEPGSGHDEPNQE